MRARRIVRADPPRSRVGWSRARNGSVYRRKDGENTFAFYGPTNKRPSVAATVFHWSRAVVENAIFTHPGNTNRVSNVFAARNTYVVLGIVSSRTDPGKRDGSKLAKETYSYCTGNN